MSFFFGFTWLTFKMEGELFLLQKSERRFSTPLLRTPLYLSAAEQQNAKSPERYRSRLLCLYVHIICIMSGADIVKGSERVSSLGAHRFILFGVLHPPHQRFGVLFAFGVHFSRQARFLVRVDIPSVLSGAMMQTRPCRSSSRARWTVVL